MEKVHSKGQSHSAPETDGITIRWAGHYDLVVGLLSKLAGGKWSPAKATLELAGLVPGEKVLDVGCGTGTLALAAQEQVGPAGEVHGIDADPEMIAVARRKAGKAGVGPDLRVGLIEDIPFPDDQFDVVLSSLMIHHL